MELIKTFCMFFLLNFLVVACSCDTEILPQRQLLRMAEAEDPNTEVILPEDMTKGIKCSDYGPGCQSGRILRIRNVDIVLLEFNNKTSARNEALRIDQYYVKNWVFDDVTGEPVVEHFIRKVYNASRPSVDEKP